VVLRQILRTLHLPLYTVSNNINLLTDECRPRLCHGSLQHWLPGPDKNRKSLTCER